VSACAGTAKLVFLHWHVTVVTEDAKSTVPLGKLTFFSMFFCFASTGRVRVFGIGVLTLRV